MDNLIKEFERALITLDRIKAKELLHNNDDPIYAIQEIVVPALKIIGDKWQDGSLALSQIYMSGRICEELIDELLPPSSEKRTYQPKMAIAVLNDYHFLGKRIIYSQIRSAGYELMDYQRKTVDELVDCISKDKIEVILISTLMYPSALEIKEVKAKLAQASQHVKIIVGGAPFNMDEKLWQQVGADAMGLNGNDAINAIENLIRSN